MNQVVKIPDWLHVNLSNLQSPDWLVAYREKHWQAFLQHGFPSRKNEYWKYTDLSFVLQENFSVAERITTDELQDAIHQHRLQRGESILLVLVNGFFAPELSDLAKLPANVIACNMALALEKHAELIQQHLPETMDAKKYPFANLNMAIGGDGLFLQIPEQTILETPIHLLSIIVGNENFITHPQQMIILGEHSKLTLFEEYFALVDHPYMMNMITTSVIGKDAKLDHYKLQHEGSKAIHMAYNFIQQAQNSEVTYTNFSLGSYFGRDDVVVHLQEPGAKCRTGGFYQLRSDRQYIDNHIDIEHMAERTMSEMLYKGVLDRKSRAVFNGRLHVHKDAQKILAYQANHNLLLSHDAEVYSKPELEIYADDVKCKHGASTGQIDADALFYLRSRGISHIDALHILLQGFADEILQRITHPGMKLRVQEMMY